VATITLNLPTPPDGHPVRVIITEGGKVLLDGPSDEVAMNLKRWMELEAKTPEHHRPHRMEPDPLIPWEKLSKVAWEVRESAILAPGGKTKVGAAALSASGKIYGGCNLQHKYRCDIHAEVAAITHMKMWDKEKLVAILIAADCAKFTPCGACLDWIFEMGGPECWVAFEREPGNGPGAWKARELMPEYPIGSKAPEPPNEERTYQIAVRTADGSETHSAMYHLDSIAYPIFEGDGVLQRLPEEADGAD
jgi:cytidine deaminase